MNHNWLDDIKENQAYFLGYFYGDGSVRKRTKNSYEFQFQLHQGDAHILYDFRTWLDNTNKIYTISNRPHCAWSFSSTPLFIAANQYGIVPNKTYVQTNFGFLNEFDDVLFVHWLHGFSDAEGSIATKYGRQYSLTGHISTLDSLNEIINCRMDVDGKLRKQSNGSYQIQYRVADGTKILAKFVNNPYKGIDRKYQTSLNYLGG